MDPAARPVVDGGRPALTRFDARNGWGHHAGRVALDAAIEAARRAGSRRVDRPQHEPLRDRGLVRPPGGRGRADRDLAFEHVAARRPDPRAAAVDRHEPHRPGGAGGPVRIVLPRHGDLHDPARPDRGRGPARRAAAGRLGHRRRRVARPTTPEAALAGALHPLGGEEATGGHKGYGLALAVDLLTGVLAGASFGPNIVGLFSTDGPSDLGQTFIVIDPAAVDAPGAFEARLEGYLDQLVAAPTIPDAPGPRARAGRARGGGGTPLGRSRRDARPGPREAPRRARRPLRHPVPGIVHRMTDRQRHRHRRRDRRPRDRVPAAGGPSGPARDRRREGS